MPSPGATEQLWLQPPLFREHWSAGGSWLRPCWACPFLQHCPRGSPPSSAHLPRGPPWEPSRCPPASRPCFLSLSGPLPLPSASPAWDIPGLPEGPQWLSVPTPLYHPEAPGARWLREELALLALIPRPISPTLRDSSKGHSAVSSGILGSLLTPQSCDHTTLHGAGSEASSSLCPPGCDGRPPPPQGLPSGVLALSPPAAQGPPHPTEPPGSHRTAPPHRSHPRSRRCHHTTSRGAGTRPCCWRRGARAAGMPGIHSSPRQSRPHSRCPRHIPRPC